MANSNYFADKSSNGYNQVKKPIDQPPDTSQSFKLLNQQDSQIPRLFDSSTVVPDIQSFQHQFVTFLSINVDLIYSNSCEFKGKLEIGNNSAAELLPI